MGRPPHLAARMADIEPFHVMELLARARALEAAGRSIVHMEIGEPDFTAPPAVVKAGHRALAEGQTRYTPALGLPALREAIAVHYADAFGVTVSPERIVITPGASGALLLALGVLVNPGDEVLMADPGYPCNRHFVRLLEGRTRAVPVGPETGYQLTAAHLATHWSKRTIGALVASPSNPTGTLLAPAALGELADATAKRNGALIVDEIYQGLVYDRPLHTALAASEDVFVVNSFSKYFCMTGWRLGWLVVPEGYRREVEKLAQNIFIAASTPAQHAALAAFTPETHAVLEQRREEFQRRRDFLRPALESLGFSIPVNPEGAFYLYADSTALSDDSQALAYALLEEAGVAVTPGIDFGVYRPEHHLRFAYTTSLEQLKEGVDRIARFLGR